MIVAGTAIFGAPEPEKVIQGLKETVSNALLKAREDTKV